MPKSFDDVLGIRADIPLQETVDKWKHCHSGLGPESSEVASALDSLLAGNDGGSHGNDKTEHKVAVNCKALGELLGRSASTIRRAVRELALHGLIEWTKERVNRATRLFRFVFSRHSGLDPESHQSAKQGARDQGSEIGEKSFPPRRESRLVADSRCALQI